MMYYGVLSMLVAYVGIGIVVNEMLPPSIVAELRDFAKRISNSTFESGFEWGRENPTRGVLVGVLGWPVLVLGILWMRRAKAQIARLEEHLKSDPWVTACMCEACCMYRSLTRMQYKDDAMMLAREQFGTDDIIPPSEVRDVLEKRRKHELP